MDLILKVNCTDREPAVNLCDQFASRLLTVSCRNVAVFTSREMLNVVGELDNKKRRTKSYHVYAVDIENPWDVHSVTSQNDEITHLVMDKRGCRLVIADKAGSCQVWSMKDYLINVWECIGKTVIQREHFVGLTWLHQGGQVIFNVDKKDSILYTDKFIQSKGLPSLSQFGGTSSDGWLALTHSGLICVGVIKQNSPDIELIKHRLNSSVTCLSLVDFAFSSDGSIHVACNSTGSKNVQIFKINLALTHQICTVKSDFITSFSPKCSEGKPLGNDSMKILKFADRCKADNLVVAVNNIDDCSVTENWVLRDSDVDMSRAFMSDTETHSVVIKQWHNKGSVQHASMVLDIAMPRLAIAQSGTDKNTSTVLPRAIMVSYSDGTVKTINLTHLQPVLINDMSGVSGIGDKKQKTTSPLVSIEQTSLGCCLLGLDANDNFYLFKVYNTQDSVTQVPMTHILSLIEYAIAHGYDCWDVLVTLRPAMVETVIQHLSEQYLKQPAPIAERLYSCYLSVKTSLYRCSSGGEQKAEACQIKLLLTSVASTFRSLLRPQRLSGQDKSPAEMLKFICSSNTECDLDQLLTKLDAKDYWIDPGPVGTLLSLQQLIQWAADFVLYLLASLPTHKYYQTYPGQCIIQDHSSLCTLRQLLVIIRMWGVANSRCLPTFTSTTNLDCLALLFKLLTKTWLASKENAEYDDALIDDCCLLSSQFMIPNMDMFVNTSPMSMLIMQHNYPITFEYGVLPDHVVQVGDKAMPQLLDVPLLPNQKRDVLRQIHLGKTPSNNVRCCCRCGNLSLLDSSSKSSSIIAWDQRWVKMCLCGGQWKLLNTAIDES